MKGPVPSQEPIKNHGMDQSPSGFSRTLVWKERGQWAAQSSYSSWVERFLVQGNQPAWAVLGGSSLTESLRMKQSRTARRMQPQPNLHGDGAGAIKSIPELSQDDRVQTWGGKSLAMLSERNDVSVWEQIEDCNRVEPEIRDALYFAASFFPGLRQNTRGRHRARAVPEAPIAIEAIASAELWVLGENSCTEME